MSHKADSTHTDQNSGNDGFVWSGRAVMLGGFILAAIMAAVRYAPVLASPLEWLPH